MSRFTGITALFMISLLFSSMLTYAAARPGPNLVKTQNQDDGIEGNEIVDDEEKCEGVKREECLKRRTLAAHVDYIYTQKHNKP